MNFHYLFSTVNDVGHILAVLRKVGFTSAAWWELGIELKLGLDTHAMETDHKTSYRCMLETVEIWLRNGDDPSWEALVDAVSQCGRGGKNIAAAIQREIGRGEFKLLQKLNNNDPFESNNPFECNNPFESNKVTPHLKVETYDRHSTLT